jgi:hypothetical protein
MRRDQVALHGFGKMFSQFWHHQQDNFDKLRHYTILRGGIVETPGLKVCAYE